MHAWSAWASLANYSRNDQTFASVANSRFDVRPGTLHPGTLQPETLRPETLFSGTLHHEALDLKALRPQSLRHVGLAP